MQVLKPKAVKYALALLSCPLRYFFQRFQRLPQTSVDSSLVLGSSVHAALAEYHRTVQ